MSVLRTCEARSHLTGGGGLSDGRWIVKIFTAQRGFCWQHFCMTPDNGVIVPYEEACPQIREELPLI